MEQGDRPPATNAAPEPPADLTAGATGPQGTSSIGIHSGELPPGGLTPDGQPPDGRSPGEPTRWLTGPTPWSIGDLMLVVLAGLFFSIVLMIPVAIVALGDDQAPTLPEVAVMGLVVYVSMFLSGWLIALKRKGARLRDAGFRPVAFTTLLKMLPITLGMMFANAIVLSVSAAMFGEVPTAQDQIVGDTPSITFVDFLWLFALAAVAAPIVEEFLFRGLLYKRLRHRLPIAAAVVISAFVFAALHFIPPLLLVFITMGVVLALLVERHDSLYPAMLVHALNNGVAIVAIYVSIGRG